MRRNLVAEDGYWRRGFLLSGVVREPGNEYGVLTMGDALNLAAEYWPELVSLGLFVFGAMALAAAVAWVEGRIQAGE